MADTTIHTPSFDEDDASTTVELLQDRLFGLIDLALTLKHAHWNVTGPNFIAVHEMLDPQTDAVRLMSDAVAERIATLGGQPVGTPQALVDARSWSDYGVARDASDKHLRALNDVYGGVIEDHRSAIKVFSDTDAVSEDLLIGQTGELELFQWFVRSHIDS